MKAYLAWGFLALCACFWVFVNPAPAAEPGLGETPRVKLVELRGNRKIEAESILAKVQTKAGDLLSMDLVRADIKAIYKIGYFQDVRADMEIFEGGLKLIFTVKEKPTLTRVSFSGNDEVDDDAIKERLTLKAGAMVDRRLIDQQAQRLRELYEEEGFWRAEIVPVLNKISEDASTLLFKINEGHEVRIDEIAFEGVRALKEKELEKAMVTKTHGLLSWFTKTGRYLEPQMQADVERIKDLYADHGYIQTAVAEPELSLDEEGKRLTILIRVNEGEQYRVGSVTVEGTSQIPVGEVLPLVKTAQGAVFSRGGLRRDLLAITDYYAERGYAFAQVVPRTSVNEKDKLVSIALQVEESGIVRVGRIDIEGNTVTRDKVIRREIRLDEGDVFVPSKLRRSFDRINNLRYFETVDLRPQPHPQESEMDITVDVKEQSTGMFTVGGGYSSVDGLIATADVTFGNFLGRGQTLKVKGEIGGRTTDYAITFKEPWLMDRPISLSVSIYNQETEYFDYDKRAKGAGLSLGKPLSEYTRATLGYNFERASIFNVDESASSRIKDQEGTFNTSEISFSLVRDSRDNYLIPRTGSRNSFFIATAGGILGGDRGFWKITADSAWWFPVFSSSSFSVRGRIGYAKGLYGDDLPLYERFYVGGLSTVRGIEFGHGGPLDENDEPIGGNKQIIFNVEYNFPILKEAKLFGVVFFDAGKAFDDSEEWAIDGLRQTVGGGFRWISPIAPIRLEWGYNLDPKLDEPDSQWEFSFGSFF